MSNFIWQKAILLSSSYKMIILRVLEAINQSLFYIFLLNYFFMTNSCYIDLFVLILQSTLFSTVPKSVFKIKRKKKKYLAILKHYNKVKNKNQADMLFTTV